MTASKRTQHGPWVHPFVGENMIDSSDVVIRLNFCAFAGDRTSLYLYLLFTSPGLGVRQTMQADFWWTRVKIDLYQKKLLRWVIPINNLASAGEPMPNQNIDPEGYVIWAESYYSVEASLHKSLEGMLAVVLADPRYQALGEYGRILDRIRVIREIYADYDVASLLLLLLLMLMVSVFTIFRGR